MGKLDAFLEKIGWTAAEEENEDDGTYEEPRTAVYAKPRDYRGNQEVRLSHDEPEELYARQSAPVRNVQQPASRPASRSQSYGEERSNPKVVNLHASVQMEVVVASPESFDEAKGIADDLRNNKPVVINLEFVEHPIAQRITDFLCGACYALGGNVQQIADKIYMIAPGNVDIAASSDFRRTLQNESGLVFPWSQD
ncbi:MAG: cell division protein SepF [Firmicutes bacterium]|nr:cell division protein SepF [Bacillota bacterium]